MRAGFAVLVVLVVMLMIPAQGLADIIDLGYVSFDNLIPAGPGSPGTNGFTIGNLTGDPSLGGNAPPPTLPVITSITFRNSSREWFPGVTAQTVRLGAH